MNTPEQTTRQDNEISVVDLLIILLKRKKLIVGLPLASAAIAAAVSFALPNIYRGTTTLLPPQQSQSGATALLSQLGGMAGMAAGAAGIKNPSDLYIGMLKSRTLENKLVEKFDLKKVYETDSQEKARRKLEESTTINSGKDGLITIDVEDKDGTRAAALANSYVAELMQLTKVMAVTEAGQRRIFYERQLEQAKDNLAKAEGALKGGLDAHGVISVDTESQAVLQTIGRLRAQASAKEIQLSSMRAFITPNNPEFKRVEEELRSARAELAKLENGRGEESDSTPAVAGDKQSGMANIKLLRDVKYYQMLYELLAKQYEVARLDEAKDPAVIQVLDPAVEPEFRFKPHRLLIILLASLGGLFVATFWAFLGDAKRRAVSEPFGAAKWDELSLAAKLKR